MPSRLVSVLVADEIYYNLNGKAIIQGIYNSDLSILHDPTPAPQLVFYFMAETDLSEPFRSLRAEIKLPGAEPISGSIPVMWPIPAVPSDRTRMFVRWPVLAPNPILRPGRIEAKLVHESGELIATAPWITLNQKPPAMN